MTGYAAACRAEGRIGQTDNPTSLALRAPESRELPSSATFLGERGGRATTGDPSSRCDARPELFTVARVTQDRLLGNTLFPYTTLFRSSEERRVGKECRKRLETIHR